MSRPKPKLLRWRDRGTHMEEVIEGQALSGITYEGILVGLRETPHGRSELSFHRYKTTTWVNEGHAHRLVRGLTKIYGPGFEAVKATALEVIKRD